MLDSISLPGNVLVNGWSEARGLIEEGDYGRFRERIKSACYAADASYRRAGYGAATMWRFLKTMQLGDWVVVPHWGGVFYVATITGNPVYLDTTEAHARDICYRRPVEWMNNGKPISRGLAKARLRSRMKTYQTSAEAKDLIPLIQETLELAAAGTKTKSFADDLRGELVKATLEKLHSGFMSERRFEQLVEAYLRAKGATDVVIKPRQEDKGADIVALLSLADVSDLKLGVQVKWHAGETDEKAVRQVADAIDAEGLDLAWVVTAAPSFSVEAHALRDKITSERNLTIELVTGLDFAELLVDTGLARL